MATFFSTHFLVVVIVLAVVAGLFLYFLRYKQLSTEEALSRAVRIAYKFWEAYNFKMPGLLLSKGGVSAQDLIEAGLVLKSLVVGEVGDTTLSSELRRARPELLGVDPMQLASAVREIGLKDYGPRSMEATHAGS
jgi:hypothetical protein